MVWPENQSGLVFRSDLRREDAIALDRQRVRRSIERMQFNCQTYKVRRLWRWLNSHYIFLDSLEVTLGNACSSTQVTIPIDHNIPNPSVPSPPD